MDDRELARWLAVSRMTIGLALLVAPSTVLRLVLDARTAKSSPAKWLGRVVGGRDLLLGAGMFTAYREDAQLGRWCRYSMVADFLDGVSTIAAYRHLPRRRRVLTLMAAAGSTVGSAYLSSRIGD